MTSTASQQNTLAAQNSPAPTAPSYASAAGSTKKSSQPPVSAAGSGRPGPPVVVGSVQNGRSASSALNGKPSIAPALPTAPRSNINGSAPDHHRKGSVTISSFQMQNGSSSAGAQSIQFGFTENSPSPAIVHSQPDLGRSAPIPIPSPQNPPTPIPQSGNNRAPASATGLPTFGSFPGDGDQRAMKQGPNAPNHMGYGGPNPRGGFAGRGGRGGYHGHGNGGNGGGYPPPPRNYGGSNGGRGQQYGRGGMQPSFGPNSPQPHRASPAASPAMPHGNPAMPPAGLASAQPYYPPQPLQYSQHVTSPSPHDAPPASRTNGKKARARRDSEKSCQHPRPPYSSQKQSGNQASQRGRRNVKQHWGDQGVPLGARGSFTGIPMPPTLQHLDGPAFSDGRPARQFPPFPQFGAPIDLSPASGDFDRLLTMRQTQQMSMQQFPPPPLDPFGRIMYSATPYQPPPMGFNVPSQHAPASGFHGAYAGPGFSHGPPVAQPMSRNSSQVSEQQRPASSASQNPPPLVASSTPQTRPAQPAPPAVVSSTSQSFGRPARKSAAIPIKNLQGEVVDLTQMKPPASPVPSVQNAKTPPVVSSTPTPPPKAATPFHHRTESTSAIAKTAEQLRNEFKDAVRKTAETPTEAKAEEGEEVAVETDAAANAVIDKLASKDTAEAENADDEAKAVEPTKARQAAHEAPRHVETDANAVQNAQVKQPAEQKSSAPAEMTDEEMERIIAEMEAIDARREAEQAEISKKKAADAAAKKAAEEAAKKASQTDEALKAQEREMERLEEEREQRRKEREAQARAGKTESVADLLKKPVDGNVAAKKDDAAPTLNEFAHKLRALSPSSGDSACAKGGGSAEKRVKPAALNLAPLTMKTVEPAQPSAAIQSLKSARFLSVLEPVTYPAGIHSPNPSLNPAATKKGKKCQYDQSFLLQFQKVFTEQPSVEFHQQVKALIGDTDSRSVSARTPGAGSGRQGSRAGSSAFPSQGGAMGQFGAQKSLRSGSNSAERFALSQGTMPRPTLDGHMPSSFGGRGGFPGPSQMSRTPSSNMGGNPNSPRQGNRSHRNQSKRGGYNDSKEAQSAKNMPLTQGMDLKPIMTSATGWKPSSVGNRAAPAVQVTAGHLDPEMVQRKVKAALNKMTPEKFDKISNQILEIAAQSKNEQDGRTLRQVIQLTFEKATDEAHWASMYAKFCKRMLETMSSEIRDENILDRNGNVVSGGALFRKYLLNRCQEEFERGWKVDLPTQPEEEGEKTQEAALMSDEYYVAAAAKRRGLGLVQFIGELFKLGMLTERIMHECVRKLLEFQGMPDEAEIESLTKLLRTIGANLDETDKGHGLMDAYFQRINSIVEIENLPSRLKFMLMDVVDLRKVGWVTKDTNKGPKTLEEVRAEVEAQNAQKAAEAARSNQRGGPGGRAQGGRGDARNFSHQQQAPPNNASVDTSDFRRLKGSAVRPSSSQNFSFAPTSMFNSRSNSGRRGPSALGRPGEDSGAPSRTGTPPTQARDSISHANAFSALADAGDHPASPPSTAASPVLAKVVPDTSHKDEKA